ncbi:MAG: hypothetical protein J5833_03815 [Victivallales bacterium]|nr:hypothetical protein [Victivallales bacterium]
MSEKMRLALKFLGILMGASLLLYCSSLEERRTLFFITLHELVPSPGAHDVGMVMEVRTADGTQRRHVRKIPITSSAYIYKIDVIPGKDRRHWGLRLYFDEVAKGLWHEAFHYRKGDQVAVIVDGFLAGFSNIGIRRTDECVLELDGLWNRQEAEAIAAQAKHNHDLYAVKPW